MERESSSNRPSSNYEAVFIDDKGNGFSINGGVGQTEKEAESKRTYV